MNKLLELGFTEKEIDNFIPEEFWEISADCTVKGEKKSSSFTARLSMIDGKKTQMKIEFTL